MEKTCAHCGATYQKRASSSWREFNESTTCSRSCAALHRRREKPKKGTSRRVLNQAPGQNNYHKYAEV